MLTLISISSLKGSRVKVTLMQNKSRYRNTGTKLYSILKGNFTFIKKRNEVYYIESWLVSRQLIRIPWNNVMCWSPCWNSSFYSEEYIQFSLLKYTYAPSFYCSENRASLSAAPLPPWSREGSSEVLAAQ